MNFSSFGSNFATALPTIHQFAAKFTQGTSSTTLCPPLECNQRYTANGIPTFTQHHHADPQQLLGTVNASKYQNNFINQTIYSPTNSNGQEKRQNFEQQELAHELCAVVLQHEKLKDKASPVTIQNQQQPQFIQSDSQNVLSSAWQSTASVANYLASSALPLSIQHFLKYSTDNLKKENVQQQQNNGDSLLQNLNVSIQNCAQVKKKKKKPEKERKPRPKPGEIRLTTALDGSTLYCCPECHMAYPDKELLEQHLLGHTLERRFVCDVCGAGLKRKDHLTRHKQSHNPERPYVCTVCLKAFKRKEQLTLHFVIHSGEKRHLCPECGKGFYRKDHLRKHTRSHIARRVKAELSQQSTTSQALHLQVPAPASNNVTISSCVLP